MGSRFCFGRATAVSNALALFRDTIAESMDSRLKIVVDNTSCEAALRRCVARSAEVNRAIRPAIEELYQLRHIVVPEVEYISTSLNPSDSVSRGREPDFEATRAVASNLRLGGGGAALRSFVPSS